MPELHIFFLGGGLGLLVVLLYGLSARFRLPPVVGKQQFRYGSLSIGITAVLPWLVVALAFSYAWWGARDSDPALHAAVVLIFIFTTLMLFLCHLFTREFRVVVDDEAVTVEVPFKRKRVPFSAMGRITVRHVGRASTAIEVRGRDDKRLLWISEGINGRGELAELIRVRAGLPKPPGRLWQV